MISPIILGIIPFSVILVRCSCIEARCIELCCSVDPWALTLPPADILEEEETGGGEKETQPGGLYNVPGGDLITQLYTSSGELLDLTYRAGKLYDSQDNIITNLFKVRILSQVRHSGFYV